MASTKDKAAITQVTATGNSTDIDTSDDYNQDIFIKHVNGTGTITAGAQIDIRVRPNGSSQWYVLGSLYGNTTASSAQTWVVPLPQTAAEVDLDYTAPTGSTGHTLDAEVGRMTAIS